MLCECMRSVPRVNYCLAPYILSVQCAARGKGGAMLRGRIWRRWASTNGMTWPRIDGNGGPLAVFCPRPNPFVSPCGYLVPSVAECGRLFSRSGLPRHKCLDERRKPVSEQRGSRQCSSCERWFRSAGGLAVHKCPNSRMLPATSSRAPCRAAVSTIAAQATPPPQRVRLALSCCKAHCGACGRCCRSTRGFQIHSCRRWLSRRAD